MDAVSPAHAYSPRFPVGSRAGAMPLNRDKICSAVAGHGIWGMKAEKDSFRVSAAPWVVHRYRRSVVVLGLPIMKTSKKIAMNAATAMVRYTRLSLPLREEAILL